MLNFRMHCRHYSKLASQIKTDLDSKTVRQAFLDYFIKDHGHKFIPSSSVVPYFDTTIPFVNAGMCQFKNVFLGEEEIEYNCAANSQKCIRIGGKHNDLSVIGIDSYHHTFFEMLGNWSFGKYFKKEACKLAWELLTKCYCINPNRIYVTYFKGDPSFKLEGDQETYEIWKEIGVKLDHIIPFGIDENFWEMGPTGPCGPSTELHIASTEEYFNTPHLVNQNNPLLTELWNLVFITHNRTEDGVIKPLKKSYVDTGMGFERLLALVQGKNSNYDTDLFAPFFHVISKESKAPPYGGKYGIEDVEGIDEAYRIVSDYSRMMTVAASDHVLPDINRKLRRIMRKAILVIQRKFNIATPGYVLQQLSCCVAESLGHVYPEIESNLQRVNITYR